MKVISSKTNRLWNNVLMELWQLIVVIRTGSSLYKSLVESEITSLLVCRMLSVHSAHINLIPSLCDCLLSRYLLKLLTQKPHSRPTGEPVYLGCASVRACQLLSCLSMEMMGIWDTILCNAIFKEILHNSSFYSHFFWRAFLKVSLADSFNLTSL